MADFSIEIAGICVSVHSLFSSTLHYCKKYLTEKPAEFEITIKKEDLVFEQWMLDEEAETEGMKKRIFSEPFLEGMAIQRRIAEAGIDKGILLIHGSMISVDNRAYLFTADCHMGKSTHTRLWRQQFGDRAVMVNDDKPFIRIDKNGILGYGSPWSGKHGLDENVCVPLAGICILERDLENRIERYDPDFARAMILKQSYTPIEKESVIKRDELVERLLQHVKLWHLYCNKDSSAALLSYQNMSN